MITDKLLHFEEKIKWGCAFQSSNRSEYFLEKDMNLNFDLQRYFLPISVVQQRDDIFADQHK